MDRRWAVAAITIILIILIYNFLTSVFRSDQKRFSHDRIFVDYSEYRHSSRPVKSTGGSGYTGSGRSHPNAYKAAREANEIKKTMFSNVMTATISSYNKYMSQALKDVPSPTVQYPKPLDNKQYQQIIDLAARPLPEYQSGLQFFTRGEYDRAISKFNDALQAVDQMDVKRRVDIFGMLAECYLKLRNEDGYIQNKIRQVRMERRLKKVLEETFPDKVDSFKRFDWITTQEASKQLLRMRSLAARSDSPQMNEMLKRAELDLEVSRKVTQ